jgi:hypothetical protein
MQYLQKVNVITPADSQDLVSLDTVKAYFNILNDFEDERLQSLITFASSIIAGLCDRSFGLATVAETVTVTGGSGITWGGGISSDPISTGGEGLVLSRYPLIGIASLEHEGTVLTSDEYDVFDYEGSVLHGGFIGDNVVTYTAGYDLPDEAPGPLAAAAIEVIRQAYYYGTRDPFVQSITDNATGSIRFFPQPGIGRMAGAARMASPLSPQASALIQPYKRMGLA